MTRNYLLLMLTLGMSAACAQAEPTPTHELTVPNLLDREPACVVKVPVPGAQCTPEGCILSGPAGTALDSITLSFSCLPRTSPTGFERPVSEAKVQTLRTKNARGHFMHIDVVWGPPDERSRELQFCLFGKLNNFCSGARVMSLDYRTKVKATQMVKAFAQGIELQEPWTKNGR